MSGKAILTEVNKDVLRAVNLEVSLRARKFSDQLLSGVFRAIFRVEQSFEFAEPEVFRLEHDPGRIAWSRLDSYNLKHLPVAIANEEVCANRYQLFTEYDFVVLADVSRSMMLRWGTVYGMPKVQEPVRVWTEFLATKLYFLKYILLSFLSAARKNNFTRSIKLFGADRIMTYSSKEDAELEESILYNIDQHFRELAESELPEGPKLPDALREMLEYKKRCIVLCVSDFMDGVPRLGQGMRFQEARMELSDFIPSLAELAYRHKVLVFRINDTQERREHEMQERVSPDNAYYDMESNPTLLDKGEALISPRQSRELSGRVEIWRRRLSRALHSRGIDFENFEAGSLINIDRAIYRLGLVTGA